MCFPNGRSGPHNYHVSVGTLHTLLYGSSQRSVATEIHNRAGQLSSSRARSSKRSGCHEDSRQCQLPAYSHRCSDYVNVIETKGERGASPSPRSEVVIASEPVGNLH